jgi:hypothetical protein
MSRVAEPYLGSGNDPYMYMGIDGKSDPEETHSVICQGVVNDRLKINLLHDLVEFLLGISNRHRRKGDI